MSDVANISEKALLVNLQISQWMARKHDRSETRALNQRHGLTVDAARVNKQLLPFAAELDRVHKTTAAIRHDFAKNTLPWGQEGVNILNVEAYFEFTGKVNAWKSDWQSSVDAFLAAYPTYRQEAEVLLGSLFNPEDYPSENQLAEKFRFNVQFMPVPAKADWRVDLSDSVIDDLRASLEDAVRQSMSEAMRTAWQRVYQVVSKAHERLSDPKNIFRDTLVENAQELVALLPALNIARDPDLDEMRRTLEKSLCAYNPSTLREDPAVRQGVAEQMAEIMRKMGPAYG